jgi:hypothetical protein
MCDKNELIECLHETTPFCTDIINLITDYAIPIKFEVNKLYMRYCNDKNDTKIDIPWLICISKINKKNIRNVWFHGNAPPNVILLKDFISFEIDTDRTNYRYKNSPLCFTLKYYDTWSNEEKYEKTKYECTSDYLVYRDDKYLYFGYCFDDEFKKFKLKKDSTGQEYISNDLTRIKNKIYPMDKFDKTKLRFLNIPPHLKKYL